MKIELWYDAVAQETDTLVNSVAVEKNDVFGFLYPVRNYPLQSWIYPNGSWKGIEYQIEELARDEDVDLTFHGRKCDYDDLCKCLSENSRITMRYVEWDICGRYDNLFSELLRALKQNDAVIRAQMSAIKCTTSYHVDFNVSEADARWAYSIVNDKDLAEADEFRETRCYYVHSSFFTSYEKMQELLSLTRSLKIPEDAVYCCFADKDTKDAYQYYARAHKRMRFQFCLEETSYPHEAKLKYGHPYIVKQKMGKCSELTSVLQVAYQTVKESTQAEFNILKKSIVNLNRQDKDRYSRIKQLRDSIDWFMIGMEEISGYIDTLLSVSKENKDEVFHYECIDELEKKIELYLKSSFSGVK